MESATFPPSLEIRPSVLYFGTPVALISTLNPDGSANLSPMSSAWALGNRVILGLGLGGQALFNLERDPECVINLPPAELWPQVERLGPTTGRNPVPDLKQNQGYRFEPRKFETAGLTPVPSQTVRPPRVGECLMQMEAQVLRVHEPVPENDEAAGFAIVETRVLKVHVQEPFVVPGTQHVNVEGWSPLYYVFRHYFGLGPDLGKNFRAER